MLQVEFIRLALSEVYPDVLIGGNESALRTLLALERLRFAVS